MSNDTTSWPSFPLGDVCRTTSGGTPSRKRADYFQGDIPWVKSGELTDGLVSQVSEFITEEAVANSSAKLFPLGTLLIAMYGATVGKLGVLAKPAATNQAVCAIFPPTELDSKFLFWFLRFKRNYLIDQAVGGAQPNISQSILRELMVPVPPIDVQRETVAEIEKQFSRLDEAVANLQRVKANLKRYKAAILKAAVEGRLVETEASIARREGRNYETGEQLLQRILEERRVKWDGKSKVKATVSPDIVDLHELPDGWAWCTADQVCEKITDGEHISPNIISSGIPLLSAKDVLDMGVTFDDAKYVNPIDAEKFRSRCAPDRGDILIVSRGATIGRACRVNTDRLFTLMGSVILMKPSNLIDGGYLMLVLKAGFFLTRLIEVSGSTAQQAIYIRDVRPLQLPLPPIAEQQRIAVEVDRNFSIISSVEVDVNRNLARTVQLRHAVLQQCFVC